MQKKLRIFWVHFLSHYYEKNLLDGEDHQT